VDKETIRAIHPSDLPQVLASLGILENLKAGKVSCSICGDPLTLESFRAVVKIQGQLRFGCRKEGCSQALATLPH